MADVLLFPSEPNPEDVVLREGGVTGPTTYAVAVSAAATGIAATVATPIPGEPPPAPAPTRGGGFARPAPVPVTFKVKVTAVAICEARVDLAMTYAGRRRLLVSVLS